MTLPRDDTALTYAPMTFKVSGITVKCWRCHDEIELLEEEDPTADHLCDECSTYYETV